MQPNKTQSAIYIIGALFFIFGFVTWLNSTLILYLKLVCQLQTDVQGFLVTSAFYMSYFVLSLPAAQVLKVTGFKRGMAFGLIVMAVGALLFIPAASQRSFPLFLLGLFIQGGGLSLLQTASNPYISILGPIESAAKRISIMGICNKGAGALAPLIFGFVLLNGTDAVQKKLEATQDPVIRSQLLTELAGRVTMPYLVIAAILLIVAWLIFRSHLPEIETEEPASGTAVAEEKKNIFGYPHLLLGVLCIFLYIGVEVMAGDAIAVYGKSEGMSIAASKNFGSYTLFTMLAGYIIGVICIPKYFSQQAALRASAILGLVFSTLTFLTTGYTAILFIALLGLANALMWPAIWPLAIDGLGRHIKTGSAMLVMGIAGAAVIPQIYASLKGDPHIGNKLAFIYCMLPCYLFILYYAVYGYKAGRRMLRVATA
ncbi:MAG TPA: sugar MFS transporter [Puia sp.]|nr:sugar MFS transporter [Puia sp.]